MSYTSSSKILDDVKKILGIDPTATEFDFDILTHINTAIATLTQIGIGPSTGTSIDSTTTWPTYIGTDKNLNPVKSYIYLKVKALFDPDNTSFVISAREKQLEEMEYRLSIYRETELLDS